MLTEHKVTELFCIADNFCKFLMSLWKNIRLNQTISGVVTAIRPKSNDWFVLTGFLQPFRTYFSAVLQSLHGREIITTRPCRNRYPAGKNARVVA